MADFTDLTAVVLQTLADTTNILVQNKTNAKKLNFVEKSDLLNTILALIEIPSYYIYGFEFSDAGSGVVNLRPVGVCKDETNAVSITIPSMFSKDCSASWVAGDTNGGLDSGVFSGNRTYFIWAIRDDVNDLNDLLFSLSNTAPNMPVGYTYKRVVGAVYFSRTASSSKIYNYYDLNDNGELKTQLPENYIKFDDKMENSSTTVDFAPFKYNLNGVEFHFLDTMNKKFIAWMAGDGNGMLDTGAIAPNTQYYLYAIRDSNTGQIDFLMSLSSTAPTMPATFDEKLLIGFLKTFDTVIVLAAWTIAEKWDDENLDITSNVKVGSVDPTSPTYEALFNACKIVVFNGTNDQFISSGKEYPHSGKVGQPIQFHGHGYPEDATAGNVYMYLDYYYTKEGVAIPGTLTRLIKIFAMPLVAAQEVDFAFNLAPAICPLTGVELAQGVQIHYNFGRLANNASDTYNGKKFAVRTFGFHYLSDKAGSDLITTNL